MNDNFPNLVRVTRGLDRLLGWVFSIVISLIAVAAVGGIALAIWAIQRTMGE